MGLNSTPRGERLHIAFFGKTNSGKSSLINSIANQDVSIVSGVAGTTTDPVYKAMEIDGIGPVVLIDTAGYMDSSSLGEKRTQKTKTVLAKTDIAVVVMVEFTVEDLRMIEKIKSKSKDLIVVVNKIDGMDEDNGECSGKVSLDEDRQKEIDELKKVADTEPIYLSAKTKKNIDKLLDRIRQIYEDAKDSITSHLVNESDVVMLVMPQDIQAPKGRLILPQVQTIRDLLENKCTVVCTTKDKYEVSLLSLKSAPDLIITDSQIFSYVYQNKPKNSKLTSFSVLFSRYKGDVEVYKAGAKKIDDLKDKDKVLIAEACSHKPLDGDISRIKLPILLKKRTNKNLDIKVVSGDDFPANLSEYSLVIHCGACMFNKAHVISRIQLAQSQDVPITNYGIAIAYMSDILDKIEL